MMVYYSGARIFERGQLISGLALGLEAGRCRLLSERDIPENAEVKRLSGGVLCPGFIETQANGGGGVLVNDDFSREGLRTVMAAHRQFGTVAMLPTFITDTPERYHQAISAIAAAVAAGEKGIIGGHFEGPFLNPEKKGTHQSAYLRQPNADDFACFERHAEHLQHSIISLAPERVPEGTIRHLKRFVPQINMAHSRADHEALRRAFCEGLTGITHLYNAMNPLQGREPGPIATAATLGLYCGIIVDGVHSHPDALQHAYQALGAQRLLLVTDSMHTIAAPEIDSFDLLGTRVFVRGDRLVNEFGSLAGAHITMLQCLQNAVKWQHCSLQDALRMAISTPAAYIQRPDLASIEQREADDILYLDEALQLQPWI